MSFLWQSDGKAMASAMAKRWQRLWQSDGKCYGKRMALAIFLPSVCQWQSDGKCYGKAMANRMAKRWHTITITISNNNNLTVREET